MIFAGSVGNPFSKKKQTGSITGNGEGIYTLDWDGKKLKKVIVKASNNASTITVSKVRKLLFAANEVRDFTGLNGSGGGVSAYRIQETGELSEINHCLSYGSRPAFVAVSDSDRYLLVANHGSHSSVTCHYVKNDMGKFVLERNFDDSSIAVFRIEEDGGIGELCDLQVMSGHGYWCYGGGQSTGHVHCVKMHHGFVYACNRGADEIEVFQLCEDSGKLEKVNVYHTRNAYAPRYLCFHPEKELMYVLYENYPALSVFSCTDGKLKELQFIETMPEEYYDEYPLPVYLKKEADVDEKNTCGMVEKKRAMPSDIHMSQDGSFLCVSNRRFDGTGNLFCYKVCADGLLQRGYEIPLDGKDPRGFMITSDNQFIIVSLLDKNVAEVYALKNDIAEKVYVLSVDGISSFVEI